MKFVNILTEGPISYNGRAFLQPIILNKHRLNDYSIRLNIYNKISSNVSNCDLLIIDSKFFRSWWLDKKQKMFDHMQRFNDSTHVIFFDTSDSAGFILGEMLPYVKSYYKQQILVDKSHYLRPMYGRRLFSDYYNKNNNIIDDQNTEENIVQVENRAYLDKIKVSWNSGLANYSFSGEYLGRIYRKIPFSGLLKYPKNFTQPSTERKMSLQCRFNTFYDKESVAYQRKAIARILTNRLQTKKVNRYFFFNELKKSKVVISPFGLGEITLKDFEVFITGGLLMKPDMSILQTWPDFYTKDTYVSFDWNLKNLCEKLELVLDNYSDYLRLAINAQDRYKYYVSSIEGNNEFLTRFTDIVFDELL